MEIGGSLNISSSNGRYEVILNNIKYNGIGYIIIKEALNNSVINEAITLIKKYNPKEIYLKLCDNLECEYSYAYSFIEMSLEKTIFKADKEIKLEALKLENREKFLGIINKEMIKVSGGAYLDNYDLIDIIKKHKAYYIYYKRELVGAYVLKDLYLDTFVISEKYQNQGIGYKALSKILNNLAREVKLLVVSNNLNAIKLYKSLGFKEIKNYSDWYKVDK